MKKYEQTSQTSKKTESLWPQISYIQPDDDTQAKSELASSYQTCRANVDFIGFLELISFSRG